MLLIAFACIFLGVSSRNVTDVFCFCLQLNVDRIQVPMVTTVLSCQDSILSITMI